MTTANTTVKLTTSERSALGAATRRYVKQRGHHDLTDVAVLDDASDYLAAEIDALGRFGDMAYADISDYAWSFARFLFPRAARY